MYIKIALLALVIWVITPVAEVQAGQDATNCTMMIQIVNINGTNGVEVTATYPANWMSRSFQTSSDLTSSNNWRGVMTAELVVPKVSSPAGELPKWTKWTVVTDNVIGPRFFRLRATL